MFWALGTGVPIVGLMLAGTAQLVNRDISGVQLGLIMVTLGGTTLISGFLVTVGAARAVADPVRAVGLLGVGIDYGAIVVPTPSGAQAPQG